MRSFTRSPGAAIWSVKSVMDEDRQRREYILHIILIGSIAMLAILDGIVLFYSLREGSADRGISFGAFSILPTFFIFLYVLFRRGYSVLASYLLIAAYFLSNSYAAYRWGVDLQVVLIAYALIIVTATILCGTKFGFFVTGSIAGLIIPLGYVQYHGVVVAQIQRTRMTDTIVFSILYLFIMIVAWLYNSEIEQLMRRAKNSEQALKEERDLLEAKIALRTDELLRIQFEKVQQLNRLAELGQLSSGLFHDLLNLLNALSLRADDETSPSIANAFNTTKQIEGFVRAIRKQICGDHERELFSLTQGVSHVIQLVNYQANKERVSIIFSPDPHADITYFDLPFKFQEIVINLLLNAIESYEPLPRSDNRVRRVEVIVKKQDGMAVLRVEDNGCGMSPAIRARIFEPFFTTKDASKGIGIGLATIKKIIEEGLSGTIVVESEQGLGSTFTVIFPLKKD